MNTNFSKQLSTGIEQLNLSVPLDTQKKLLKFIELLQKWNRIHNLTAIREPKKMLTHHILDSLAVIPYLQGNNIIDVGTGAGLPGIPLALCCPKTQFVLLDKQEKKVRFLHHVKQCLEMTNCDIVHTRAEDFRPSQAFDTVVTRAVGSVQQLINHCQHLCTKDGYHLAMKGKEPSNEIAEISPPFFVDKVIQLRIPGLMAERHLIVIKRAK